MFKLSFRSQRQLIVKLQEDGATQMRNILYFHHFRPKQIEIVRLIKGKIEQIMHLVEKVASHGDLEKVIEDDSSQEYKTLFNIYIS